MWQAFKYVLSALLLILAALLAVAHFRNSDNPAMLAAAGFFLILAALPLMDFTKPNHAVCMLGLAMVLGFAYFGFEVLIGIVVYPSECSGSRRAFCELLNFLYGIGGRPAASSPFFAMAIFLFACIIATLRRIRAAPATGS